MQQTIASAFEMYLRRSNGKSNTVRGKQKAMDYFFKWFGADMPVSDVNMAIAEDYQSLLQTVVSKSSANTYIGCLRPFFTWLNAHGLIACNPFGAVKRLKSDQKPKDPYTIEDLEKMVRTFDLKWRVRMVFGLIGCRVSEMSNTIIRDLHMGATPPHIEVGYKAATKNTWEWGSKNTKIQYHGLPETIPIGSETLYVHQDIVELMEQLPANQPYLNIDPHLYLKLIASSRAGTLKQHNINDPHSGFDKKWKLRQKWAGVQTPKRYHELRAAYATAMIQAKGIRFAQLAIGHVSLASTQAYDRKSTMDVLAESNDVTQECFAK